MNFSRLKYKIITKTPCINLDIQAIVLFYLSCYNMHIFVRSGAFLWHTFPFAHSPNILLGEMGCGHSQLKTNIR